MPLFSSRVAMRLFAVGTTIAAPLGFLATSLAAPPAGASEVAHTSAFCADAATQQKNEVSNYSSLTPSVVERELQKYQSEEKGILAIVPSQLKSDMQEVFNYTNGVITELAKYKWSYSKVPVTYFTSLGTATEKVAPAAEAISTYLTKTCGLKLSTTSTTTK